MALTSPIDDVPSEPPLTGPQTKTDEQPKDKEADTDQPHGGSGAAKS
jgi:hypothetical protein